MSDFTLIVVSFFVSTGVLLQSGVSSSISDHVPNYPLLFSSSLTFFLATIQLPFLLLNTSSTITLCPILVHYINNLSMIASLTTLMLAFLNVDQVPHWGICWAISSGLICFSISMLFRAISKTLLPGYRHYLHVAFLAFCVAFAGLYTEPPLLPLPGTRQYNSIIHVMNCLYHFALVPVNFVLGTILVIVSIAPQANLLLPFVPVTFKEGMLVLTLAVGLTTLIIGASLTIYPALVNFAAGRFEAI